MSNNKDLLGKLAAARDRAISDAQVRTPKLAPAAALPKPEVPPTAPTTAPPTPRLKAKPRPPSRTDSGGATRGQGTLERTTITLKVKDRSVLGKAQAFFIERGIKAPTSSTLIRLALHNLGETLEAKPDIVERLFDRIRREDGRRHQNKVIE